MRVLLEETDKSLADVAVIAATGEDVLLINDGKVVARVTKDEVPSSRHSAAANRKFGFLQPLGFKVPHDIKTPFEKDIEEIFYGGLDKK